MSPTTDRLIPIPGRDIIAVQAWCTRCGISVLMDGSGRDRARSSSSTEGPMDDRPSSSTPVTSPLYCSNGHIELALEIARRHGLVRAEAERAFILAERDRRGETLVHFDWLNAQDQAETRVARERAAAYLDRLVWNNGIALAEGDADQERS